MLRRIRRFFPDDRAEEILHDVFAVVVERAAGFRGDSHPFTWLYQITTRVCLNRRRIEGRRRELMDEVGDLDWSPTTAPPGQEAKVFLHELWRTLTEELAMIGYYYHVDGLGRDEIGALMGCTGRTIGNRLKELSDHARHVAGQEEGS